GVIANAQTVLHAAYIKCPNDLISSKCFRVEVQPWAGQGRMGQGRVGRGLRKMGVGIKFQILDGGFGGLVNYIRK
ncbi:MAG: hypothetical protein J6U15_02805, partial [Lachnospiraceae bacterium]|nr:hypothetical protein [Lachnospiraceae bacterium]